MIGFATTNNNFDTDIMMTTTDAVNYTLTNVVLTANIFKFRDDNSWTFQFGANGPASSNPLPSGTAIANGTDMIAPAGTFNVTFNRTTLAYSFVSSTFASNSFEKSNFNVSPNPSNNIWKIASADTEIKLIQVLDILGKVVYTNNDSSNEINIDASTLTNGIYFAKIASDKGTETIKLVKN